MQITMFPLRAFCPSVSGLPGWSTNIPDPMRIFKNSSDLFKWLASCFGKHKETKFLCVSKLQSKVFSVNLHMNEHSNAENTENDVSAPLNIDERRRYEISKCEVEGPIG